MSLIELAEHIEETHHAYLREELPRLDFMTEKVSRVHGDKEPRLLRVREAFVALKAELEPHMMKEERVLFPIIRELEASASRPEFHCGSVANPIRQMEHEHDQAGDALAIIREATDDFVPPEWACNTYRAMLDSLEKLEADMHQHVHKENNVLFPKAIEMEAARS
jgi:regulator of cell morphogenesis and NO signaling